MLRLLPFEYAVRNLGRSPLRLCASVFGAALVVLLVLTAGGFVRGMEHSLATGGRPDNVMLLGVGSEESVERSQISANAATLVSASVPGVRTLLGQPFVSPEVHAAVVLRTSQNAPTEHQAVMRGITPAAFLVHPQVQITAGRAPRAGAYELLAGAMAATRLDLPEQAVAIGETLWFDNHEWTIVGRFAAPQTVMNAELWLPLTDLQIATRRENTLSTVVLTLDTATFEDVQLWCTRRLDLDLTAMRETDYYAGLFAFYGPVRAMVWGTAALIAIGGLFGGLNTMYAAFAARVRELGALQTLGFPRRALIVSFLQESLLATAGGAILAAVLALWLIDGVAVRFSMGAFALSIDAPVLLTGLAAGAALAVVGVIPPLWRCLRMPIVTALRAG